MSKNEAIEEVLAEAVKSCIPQLRPLELSLLAMAVVELREINRQLSLARPAGVS